MVSGTIPDVIATRLLEGERVVWWGRPAQGIMFLPRDAALIPFSLLWGGFAIFWEASVLNTRAPMPFALFGVPFVLIGLFLIFGRFLVDGWLRQRMIYALTEQRVLIVRTPPLPSFKAVNLDRLPEVTLNEGARQRGTIRFGAEAPLWGTMYGRSGFGSWLPALDPTPQFLAIDDVQRVFAAVQQRSQAGRLR